MSIGVKIYIAVIAFCAILVPNLVSLIGFTPAGVTAGTVTLLCSPTLNARISDIKALEGSLAAAWHAHLGNVAAGSFFAILQSLGTNPPLLTVLGGLIGGAGCLLHSFWKGFWDEDEDGDSHPRGSEKK